MTRLFAMLVAIDEYLGDVPALRGCVNDIDRAAVVLRHRAEAAHDEVVIGRLTNTDATRDAFIATFRETFAAAGSGDTAVLYYSGHGSQEPAPPEHLRFEPDGLNETLVLADSRTPGGSDLADKELAVLVGEVTGRGAHMLVVLDCCHSGSGLRDLDDETGVRRVRTSTTHRAADSYLPGSDAVGAAAPGTVPGGPNYVLLAACRSDQTAKEVRDSGGSARGAMSVAMEAALSSTPGPVTYQQLHRSLAATVAGLVAQQTPVLECPLAADADRPFLGGAAAPATPLLTASHRLGGWQLDAGVLHGIPAAPAGGRPTRLTLHPLAADDLAVGSALATASTRTVRATTADLDVEPAGLDRDRVYRAVVRELPEPDVTLAVDAAVPGRDELLAALAQAKGLAVVDPDAASADLRLVAEEGALRLLRPGAARSLVAARALPASGAPLPAAELEDVRDQVVQVGRWLSLWRRRNPTSQLGTEDVTLEALDTDDQPLPADGGGVHVAYDERSGDWPRIRVRVRNRTQRRLYAAVLALSELYGVETLLTGGGEWLEPGQQLYVPADDGTHDLYLSVPDGEQITTDLLKLLVSSTEFTADSLRQADLARPETRFPDRGADGVEKAISARRPGHLPGAAEDWTTRELLVTTYRPGTPVAVPDAARSAPLGGGTVLVGHPTLRGNAWLSVRSEAAREASVPLLPAVLVDHADSAPFSFLPARSVGGEVDVLELDEVTGVAGVTPVDPLVLRVPQTLGPGERVLPLIFDGEDYLPVGYGAATGTGDTEIRIVRVPEQSDITRRSLGRSLKILFRKLVGRRLGAGYDWPHLSLVRRDADGVPGYEHDPQAVRAALAGADRALVLVHGIIGDTLGMSKAAALPRYGLDDGFDVVLALDYENLHTPIEATAADLAAALRAVGVEAGTGPRLTFVAHSMGGLVSRCFIEREGGAAVVERLVTCGTPHAGSPWSTIEDAATSLLGLGLNGLVALDPLGVLGSALGLLVQTVEHVDNALDQMRPGSQLLTELAAAKDPGIDYVLVRGTEGLAAGADAGIAARIVGKLTGVVLDRLFDGKVNDLAVSVPSATAVGVGWGDGRVPQVIDAACNHMSYFSGDPGLSAVRRALRA